jgi:hypothetical protein
MDNRDNKTSNRASPDDIPMDQLIAEIMERAQRISIENGEAVCMPFSNWLQAEKEIREKYGLPGRTGPEQGDDAPTRENF